MVGWLVVLLLLLLLLLRRARRKGSRDMLRKTETRVEGLKG